MRDTRMIKMVLLPLSDIVDGRVNRWEGDGDVGGDFGKWYPK